MAMANEDAADFKIDNISFEDDPAQFCRAIYEEAEERQETLRCINDENRLLYEGFDKKLEDRANDPKVKRSNLFIPEITPAIDTRIGNGLTKLEESKNPVSIRPANPMASDQEKHQAAMIEEVINGQLRDSGYLTDGVREHWLGAEIYRTPSTVKVGWEEKTKEVPFVVVPTQLERIVAALTPGAPPAQTSVEWRTEDVGRPYVEWLYPGDFLYEPNRSNFQDHSRYAIHAIWIDDHEVMAIAAERGWDEKEVTGYLEEAQTDASPTAEKTSQRDNIEEEKDTPFAEGYRDGKYLLTENYVVTYDESGQEQVTEVYMLANKNIVEQETRPIRGEKFPFVPISINQLPGTLEGLSSVDRTKGLQGLYNEVFNSYLDAQSYRIFPPFLKAAGTTFSNPPIYGPAEIWEISDINDFRPVIENPGQAPDLPSLMAAIAAKIRETLNAHDLDQGFSDNQYEKAASVKLRAAGATRRSVPTHKVYGDAVVKVAKMYITLNQENAENAEMFVMDLIVDVPSLTAVTDPELEKQESMLLLQNAEQSAVYQNPIGLKFLRNLTEDMIRQFKKHGVDEYVPSEEEFAKMLGIQIDQDIAAQQKQTAAEQLAIEQATAPPPPEPQQSNGA